MTKGLNFIKFLLVLICLTSAPGQIIWDENFVYPAGDTLSNYDWTQIRNGSPIIVHDQGLEFPGYAFSGIGNAARIRSEGGQEIRKEFSGINSDDIYVSFLINVSNATTDISGGIYLYLVPQSGDIFTRRCTAYVKKNESDLLSFGVSKNSGINYTGFNYDLNTTYLVVLKYSFNPDTTNSVSLWINPNLSSEEPEPDSFGDTGYDADEISGIILSQLTASNTPPDAIIDGICITTNWQDLPVGISDKSFALPVNFHLDQNYPNPFNPNTVISYTLPERCPVDLSVYNVVGQLVAKLISREQYLGTYKIEWEAGSLPGGYYFYRLQAGAYSETKRMVYLK